MPEADRPGRAGPRGDSGLTTLEWLLITAAVAGLAALAVVLVQAYVEDTGDRMSNPDPRVTSAIHSASEVETDAKAASAGDFDLWADWESHFTQKCSLIAVLYSDAEVEVVDNHFMRATDGFDPGDRCGTAFDPAAAALADEQSPKATKGPGAMRGGLTLSRPGLPIGLGRRMIPEPEGADRMRQHSHKTIESTPEGGSRLARRLGT